MKKLSLLLMCCMCAAVLHAQWEKHYLQYSNGDSGDGDATVIDYDGDGWKDVIVAMQFRPELMLFKNNAFEMPEVIELTDTLYTATFVHAADINQDGFDDFLLQAADMWGNSFIYYYRNDGNFNYEVLPLIYVGYDNLIRNIAIEDMDVDGDLDIIVDHWENGNILELLENIDETTFEWSWIEFDTQPIRLYGVEHFNDDDLPDFAYTKWDFDTEDYVLGVCENLGDMNFLEHDFIHVDTEGEAIVGDFMGDEKIDFAVAHQTLGENTIIMRNNGNFNFTDSGTLPVNSYVTFGPMTDYDNDGDEDILYSFNSETSLLRRNTNGTYTNQNLLTSWLPVRDFVDINNDGQKELMMRTQFGSQFDFFEKNGNDYELWHTNFSKGARDLHVMDGNNDGIMDLFGKYGGNYELNFTPQFFNGLMQKSEKVGVTVPDLTGDIEQMIPFDKESDGDMDYLYMSDWELNWAINNGNSFTISNVQNDEYGYNFWVGYLDNDNNHDILYCTGDMKRYEANGNNYTASTITGGYEYFDVIDIDGDGDKDIPYLNYDQHLRYLRNNGASFTDLDIADFNTELTDNFTMYANGFRPQFAANDLDDDGDIDFVLCDPEQDKLWWIENDNFTFTISVISSTIDRPSDFAIADFDMDGDKDIVAIATDDQILMMFNNDGDENYTVAETLSTTVGAVEVLTVDFDNDTDLDMFSTSFLFGDILWFENSVVDCPITYAYSEAIICPTDSTLFGDNYVSVPGMYLDSLTNVAGCDSVAAMVLSNYSVSNISISYSGGVCAATVGFLSYQWFIDGELVDGEIFNTISTIDNGAGDYSCIGFDDNGCSATSNELYMNPDNIPGNDINAITISPNPATATLTIQNLPTDATFLKIFDVTGRTVLTCSPQSQLNIEQLSVGVYALYLGGVGWERSVKWVKE